MEKIKVIRNRKEKIKLKLFIYDMIVENLKCIDKFLEWKGYFNKVVVYKIII